VILHLKYHMTSISVVHATATFFRHILAAKAGGFNLMMDNKSTSCSRRRGLDLLGNVQPFLFMTREFVVDFLQL
jgi:hypothetical protein